MAGELYEIASAAYFAPETMLSSIQQVAALQEQHHLAHLFWDFAAHTRDAGR